VLIITKLRNYVGDLYLKCEKLDKADIVLTLIWRILLILTLIQQKTPVKRIISQAHCILN